MPQGKAGEVGQPRKLFKHHLVQALSAQQVQAAQARQAAADRRHKGAHLLNLVLQGQAGGMNCLVGWLVGGCDARGGVGLGGMVGQLGSTHQQPLTLCQS